MATVTQWIWYVAGILVTLCWEWQKYCYEQKGTGDPPKKFWDSSLEWFELKTLGSKVSWSTTLGGAWLLGYLLIQKKGAEAILGGIFLSVPNIPPMLFFIGSLQELIVPNISKWIVSKFSGGQ